MYVQLVKLTIINAINYQFQSPLCLPLFLSYRKRHQVCDISVSAILADIIMYDLKYFRISLFYLVQYYCIRCSFFNNMCCFI